MGASRASLVSVTVQAAIILTLIFLLIFPGSQLSQPVESSFRLEFTKTGGIAGLNESLVIEANRSVTFISNHIVSFRSEIAPIEFSELKDIIIQNLDKISSKVIQPRRDAADYFNYRLVFDIGGRITEIVWVDVWAAEGTFPDEVTTLQRSIEKVLQILIVQASFTNTRTVHADLACPDGDGLCGALSMTIFTDKATYKVGEQVKVFIIVRNTGPATINYQSPTPCDPDVRIVASGDSRIQDITLSNFPIVVCIQVIEQRALNPNRTLTHDGFWNMVFDQDGSKVDAPPGSYMISARFPYANFEPALLEVSVTITVVE